MARYSTLGWMAWRRPLEKVVRSPRREEVTDGVPPLVERCDLPR
jgi:hypothetical protein